MQPVGQANQSININLVNAFLDCLDACHEQSISNRRFDPCMYSSYVI